MRGVHGAHPETAIVPYLHGDLRSPEREQVAAHVAACADCRRVAERHREVLDALAASRPEAPAVHWDRYRAELSARLEARRGDRRPAMCDWRAWRPIPLALSAALVGVLIFLATGSGVHRSTVATFSPVEETVLGDRLDLLRHYAVLEQLDLLEDLDVIRHLDRLPGARRGSRG